MGQQFNEIELINLLPLTPSSRRVVVDVGGHAGTTTKPFAERGWNVITFEPEPNNYAELCKNMIPFPTVTCIRKAVSDTAGQNIPFYVSEEHWGIHSLKPFHKTHKPSITVETVRLDEMLSNLSITDVAVLKIDTEGADFSVLKGFDWNHMNPYVVMCEIMDHRSIEHYGYTHHDVAAFMKSKGYACYVSEWAEFSEYGRKGQSSSHKFIQCGRYPLPNEPSWGNLICVPENLASIFDKVLLGYLKYLSPQ
jgi:FkbM family methyltransferase